VYLVNGAGIRPKESDTTIMSQRTPSDHALPNKASAMSANSAQLRTPPASTGNLANKTGAALSSSANITKNAAIGATSSDSSVEQIMLQFQQTMQSMANSFLETQQRVMLAFIESQNGTTHSISTQLAGEFTTDPALVTQAQLPTVVELQSTGTQATVNSAVTEQPAQLDTEYLINSLVEIVAERTGYPVDMIDPTLDLEADLGIDSIKRVEILNKFRRLLPESTQQKLESGIEELAGTRTLQGIIDWFRVHQDTDVKQIELQPAELPSLDKQSYADGNGGNGKHDAAFHPFVSVNTHTDFNGGNGKDGQHLTEVQESGTIRRALVAPVLLPKLSFDHDKIYAKTKEIQSNGQVVLITEDKLGLADSLSELLKQYGFIPIILQHSQTDAAGPLEASLYKHYAVNLENSEQVQACLADCQNTFGKFAMFFHLQSFGEESANLNRASAISLLHLLKYISNNTGKQQRIITATSMGGKFGIEQSVNGDMSGDLFSPTQAAVVGLTKVAAKELPNSICKAIDFTVDKRKVKNELKNIALQILSESVLDDSTIETGYLSDERFGLSVIDAPARHDLAKSNLNQDSVVLITGGARGITAEIAFELARHYKPTLIIVGRSGLPEKEDPHYAGLTGARELKAKIIELIREEGKPISIPHVEADYKKLVKDRELRNNLDRLKATANKVQYHNLDVRDTEALVQLIENIYKEHGRIDAVIHSAGIIEDALIKDKTTESFCRVFDTKVSSALTLLNSLKLGSLQYLFLFSSVVGRTGNAGQSDYVAANEVLNKLALAAQSKMSGRAASIMWGPWRGGMAQPELEEIFAQYGWSMISVPSGCNVFLNELLCLQKTEPEILFVAELESSRKPQATGARLHKSNLLINSGSNREYIIELDTQVDTFLLDHAFDGVPVLPMAYALELMCEAAASTYADLSLATIKTFDIPAGILFDSQRKKLSIIVQEKEKGKDHVIAQVSIHSGTTKRRENFRAVFVMGKDINQTTIPAAVPMVLSSVEGKIHPEFITGAEINLPSVAEIYRQWLFHGPKFRGIQTINAAGNQGIWGQVAGLSPDRCLGIQPSANWIIDPVMFDSSMQLGGIWARCCLDITVLPTGFKQLCFLKAPNYQQGDILTAYVLIAPTDSKNELSCDLAIYNQAGELSILVEGLTGVGNKSLHRLVGQNNVIEAGIPK